MKTFFLTDVGKVRDHNEDSVTILENANKEYLLVVADGMGGHKAGEVASSMAVNHITSKFETLETLGDKQTAINWIREEVAAINKSIFDYTAIYEESKGMGTTFVAALFTKDYLLFANVGDSSGYVYKNNKLYRVTKPHTLVNLLVESGELTPEEAEHHPRKNILMRALGANNPAEVDIFDVDTDIDGIFLCSDGLTTMLNDTQIEKVLSGEGTLEEKVTKLIRKSNIRGGTDNISIACLMTEMEVNK